MHYSEARKEAALTTGLTLITLAAFGFIMLTFSSPTPEPDMTVATVQIKP